MNHSYLWSVLFSCLWACSGASQLIDQSQSSSTSQPAEQQAASAEVQTEKTQANSITANETAIDEPIMTAGAFLSCQSADWMQGDGGPSWNCQLSGISGITPDTAIAAAFYTDANGASLAMEVLAFERSTLTWTLRENMATIGTDLIFATITIGTTELSLESNKDSETGIELIPNANFWYAGEPNQATPDETCAEFWHQDVVAEVDARTPGSVDRPTGRLNDVPCPRIQPFLCRHSQAAQPLFAISETLGAQTDFVGACPVGYHFSFPTTIAEVLEIAALIDATAIRSVWVALEDPDANGMFDPIIQMD